MKGNSQIIDLLNKLLMNELTAINQYFLHSKMHQNWGLTKLGKKLYDESIDEMKHADLLIERILFLEGLPNLQQLGKLFIGQNIKETLECDLKLEVLAIKDLRETIKLAESIQDYVTRDLAQSILNSEEQHMDWIETQLDLIDKMGVEHYMAQNI